MIARKADADGVHIDLGTLRICGMDLGKAFILATLFQLHMRQRTLGWLQVPWSGWLERYGLSERTGRRLMRTLVSEGLVETQVQQLPNKTTILCARIHPENYCAAYGKWLMGERRKSAKKRGETSVDAK